MLLDYFHLREQPFGVTPDPRYLYLSVTHREALASLYHGIDTGRGFMALISEPGMGKTTLLLKLLEQLRKSVAFAFLFQTQCNSRELLHYLLADMGLKSRSNDLVYLHTRLNQALVRMSRAGRRFVLVIDEAQDLDDSVLETVRLLSDFETASSKLIQIVLSGQPQLADKLASPSLVQLRQRIAILSRLDPFRTEETDRYIDHRLQVAGHERGQIFTSDAKSIIAARSGGIPRNINNLCFNALSLGCALGRRKIDRDIVLEVARDLDVEPLGHAKHTTQIAVPPAPATEQRGVLRSIKLRHPASSSATGSAFLVLVCLFLFLFVQRSCRTPFTNVQEAVLPLVQSIQSDQHTPQAVISTGPLASQYPFVDRDSGAVIPTEDLTVVAVKPGETVGQICFEHFRRFNRELTREILALNPQIADPDRIKPGQSILLPERTMTSKGNFSAGTDMKESTASRGN